MRLGIVISMYDEIDMVLETLANLKSFNCKIVVVQSDPGNKTKVLNPTLCDEYVLLPDLAGSKKEYEEMVEEFKRGKPLPIAPLAVTRNFSKGFSIIKNYDIDFVIAIEGDTKITSLEGIDKIIKKITGLNNKVACTRNIGYNFHDSKGSLERFQDITSTDIMPQFFIVEAKAVRKGLFCEMKVTNPYTSEVCLGDEIVRYCKQNNLEFFDCCYIISDYAYPRFIEGLEYNPNQISKLPARLEGIVTIIRKRLGKKGNGLITRSFRFFLKMKDKF